MAQNALGPLDPTRPLEGKVVLVTAGTASIGAEIALQMGQAGAATVIVNGRDAETGERTRRRIADLVPGCDVKFRPADMTRASDVADLFGTVEREVGGLDILVSCCGGDVSPRLFAEMDPANYDPLIRGHLMSLMTCSHHAVPSMTARGGGSIIALASDAGKLATPGESVHGAAKAGAIMFVRTLARELARHQIRVNAITPSIVRETRAYDRVMAGGLSKKVFEKAERRAGLGVPTPADIAPLAVFLAGPNASRITGQAISVNGGISAA